MYKILALFNFALLIAASVLSIYLFKNRLAKERVYRLSFVVMAMVVSLSVSCWFIYRAYPF